MNLILTRTYGPATTRGTLMVEDRTYYTIELPWLDNAPDKSCVPDGFYLLVPYRSPTHGATWRLHNAALNVYGYGFVPKGGRSEIELHAANWAMQLLGCIGIGLDHQPMLDPTTGRVEPAVESSRDAIAMLTAQLGSMSDGNTLMIQPAFTSCFSQKVA